MMSIATGRNEVNSGMIVFGNSFETISKKTSHLPQQCSKQLLLSLARNRCGVKTAHVNCKKKLIILHTS